MLAAVSTLMIAGLPSSADSGSGAAGGVEGSVGQSADAGNGAIGESGQEVGLTAAPELCPSVRRAVRFYSRRLAEWRAKMGAGVGGRPAKPLLAVCPRYLANVLQRKARAARREFERWHAYHYDWRSWLPDKWQRIGACETGYGRRPGNWRWNSGTYQGAFGFYHGSWDAFVPHASPKARPYPSEAYLATPRQQYEVALAIWRRFGFSGWGCRGA